MPNPPVELLLLRHAKSSWATEGLADHDRPLNPRGIAAADRMGRLCRELDRVPDRIVTSDARRTVETVEGLVEAAGCEGRATATRTLYLASPGSIVDAAREHGGDARRLLLVGHNPGVEDLASRLAASHVECPTATLSIFEIDAAAWTEWAEWNGGVTRHVGTWRPRELPPAPTP